MDACRARTRNGHQRSNQAACLPDTDLLTIETNVIHERYKFINLHKYCVVCKLHLAGLLARSTRTFLGICWLASRSGTTPNVNGARWQGASESVIESLARVLQLDEAERDHLYDDLARAASRPVGHTPIDDPRPDLECLAGQAPGLNPLCSPT
jgi:hypothetical protein